jgi:hypothetical protein
MFWHMAQLGETPLIDSDPQGMAFCLDHPAADGYAPDLMAHYLHPPRPAMIAVRL